MISDELYETLKTWLADATSENPTDLARSVGLCVYTDADVRGEMQAFWREAGLDISYPFNPIEGNYYKEGREGKCHLNPLRLAWVRERIAEYDHTLAMYEEAKRT